MAAHTRSSAAGTAVGTPPGYFLSLKVENIRCFGPAQTLNLAGAEGRPARWTLILGENGVGKTTLLQCLVAMEPMADPHVHPGAESNLVPRVTRDYRYLSQSDDQSRFSRRGNSYSEIVAHVAYGKMLEESGHFNELTFKIRSNFDYAERITQMRSQATAHINSLELSCYAYGINRRVTIGQEDNKNFDSRVASLFSDDAQLRDPEAWWLWADYNAKLDAPAKYRFERYANQVREALIQLLPDVRDVRIAPPEEIGHRPAVEVWTSDGWIPLRRLGSGYKSQLAWMVDLASRLFERYPNSDDPLAEPAVVLVDEIDLHMHPRWQREIIGYLTERLPNTQFIVTAHSPLIVQAAEDANLVLLRREGDHVVIDNDPGRLRNWRVDQILTSDLFGLESARPPQIDGLLKERRALLSKGRLTANDRRRIQALEAEIGDLPAGETVEDSRAMEIIRRAAAKLQGEGGV